MVAAIAHARERELEITVRSTGFSLAGASFGEGMIIDLSPMRSVRVDPELRTAWVGGGTTGGDLQTEVARYDLAGVTGLLPSSGIGLTLGGGYSHLLRRVGYASDNVLEVELVTADGRVVNASPEENPDLFWAVRGTSGSFGVVTSLKVQLHPVPPVVLAGSLVYGPDKRKQAIRAIEDALDWSSEDLGLVGLLGPGHVEVFTCHSGPPEVAKSELERFKAEVEPDEDSLSEISFRDLTFLMKDDFPPQRSVVEQEPVSALDDALLDALIAVVDEPLPEGSEAVRHIEFPPRAGALNRPASNPNAIHDGAMSRDWGLAPLALWSDAAEDAAHIGWVEKALGIIQEKGLTADTFEPSYLGSDPAPDRMERMYRGRFDRLRRLKREWDPDNLFHSNVDIPPA